MTVTPLLDSADGSSRRPGPVRRFAGEIMAELRKVVWPTWKQTLTYTGTVLAFLVAMVAFIGGADAAIATAVLRVFG